MSAQKIAHGGATAAAEKKQKKQLTSTPHKSMVPQQSKVHSHEFVA
jgi:hypothetical protein